MRLTPFANLDMGDSRTFERHSLLPHLVTALAFGVGCTAPQDCETCALSATDVDGVFFDTEALDPPDTLDAATEASNDTRPFDDTTDTWGAATEASNDTRPFDDTTDETRSEAPALPRCFSESAPLILSGAGIPYAEARVDGASGYFLLDWASTFSTIDPLAFDPPPRPLLDGRFPDFEWFGPWGDVWLVAQDHSGISAAVRQAGILGTDFLSVHAYALDFETPTVYRAPSPCDIDPADWADWARLDATDTFSNMPSTLPFDQPNVPAVPIRIAGVTARAQLDTGFDDGRVPHAVNVNEALFSELDPTRLERAADLDLTLTTCTGIPEPVEAWRATGELEFLDVDGAAALVLKAPVVFVKRTPLGASSCGGIGTWQRPAAQVGASVLSAARRLIFDPVSSSVFLPRPL